MSNKEYLQKAKLELGCTFTNDSCLDLETISISEIIDWLKENGFKMVQTRTNQTWKNKENTLKLDPLCGFLYY